MYSLWLNMALRSIIYMLAVPFLFLVVPLISLLRVTILSPVWLLRGYVVFIADAVAVSVVSDADYVGADVALAKYRIEHAVSTMKVNTLNSERWTKAFENYLSALEALQLQISKQVT